LFLISHTQRAAEEIHGRLGSRGIAFIPIGVLLEYILLLRRAQATVRRDRRVWLGPVPQVRVPSDKLVDALRNNGCTVEIIATSNHSASRRGGVERVIDALGTFYCRFGHHDHQRLE
jgi:hypothetical protein